MTRILLIDDDQWMRELLASRLVAKGYVVDQASDAIAALTSIDESIPDGIVLDFMLPAANAMTVIHELRTYDETMRIPIVICSAAPHIPTDQLRQYGVRSVIDKTTMQPDDIVAAVREAVDG